MREGKNLILAALFFAASSVIFTACRQSGSPVLEGKAAFNGFGCARCHRIGNEGGVYGPDLTYVGFRKSKEWLDLWLKDPHAWKKNTVMPNFNLPEDIRADLVAYLSEQKGQAFGNGPKPWEKEELQGDLALKGKEIFNRMGCMGCHGAMGKGGQPNNNVVGDKIPTLALVADGFSKEELKERIEDGRVPDPADPSRPAPMIQMPRWGEVLKDNELDALVEYLYSLRPAVPEGEAW